MSEEFNEGKEDLQAYINTRVDLIKLDLAKNLSRFITEIIIQMVLFHLFFFILLFVSLGFAFWLGFQLENKSMGFVIAGVIYFPIGLLFWFLRKTIVEKPIIKSFVQLFFPVHNDYD